MVFNSLAFFIFLPIVFYGYWFIFNKNIRNQNLFLLISSYFFYGWWDWRFLGILIFTTLIDFFLAIKIHDANSEKKAKQWLSLSVIMNIGLLCFFKYFNFFIESWITAWRNIGIEIDSFSIHIILPIGISFYTFQELSYTLDVYKKRMTPTKDFIGFAAFITFFPQLVAGPIERASHLLPQFFNRRTFSSKQAIVGCRLILWGLLKKIVIADNCAVYVNNIYSNYHEMSGSLLLLGAVYFTFQLYGDFSGYSDIAIGTAKLFGFDLMKNFNRPFISKNITEFWRRWHISLSSWFNDYLFTPLYTKWRDWGQLGMALALFVTFFLSGLWHGAGMNFILYGSMHGAVLIYEVFTKKTRKKLATKIPGILYNNISILFTFTFVVFSWIFFRSTSLNNALEFIERIFMHFNAGTQDFKYLNGMWLVLTVIILEWVNKKNEYGFFVKNRHIPSIVVFIIEVTIGLLVVDSFITQNHEQFIYFQF